MYQIFAIFILVIGLQISCKNNTEKATYDIEKINKSPEMTYDSLLARQLGVDDYGMKPYVMAFLLAGPNRNQDSLEIQKIQRAHLDNINRMAEEGKLVLAGPFLDEGEVKGIYIFNVSTIEEAEQLTKTDPAIISGRLKMNLKPWYGSGAIIELNKLHHRIAKNEI